MEPDQIVARIKCPNCGMLRQHTYTQATYNPVYGQCTFCDTKWRWTKTKTKIVIPANNQHYLKLEIDKPMID